MKRFVCARCGACCRWSGCVRLTSPEVDAIAAFLGLGVSEFLDRYTALMPDRQGLTLIEKTDGSCIFLNEEGCIVNPVKPAQCAGFPMKWNFPDWQLECKGSFEES